jgi:hypothetical protein
MLARRPATDNIRRGLALDFAAGPGEIRGRQSFPGKASGQAGVNPALCRNCKVRMGQARKPAFFRCR